MATKIRPFNLHTDTETRIQTLAGNLIDSAYVNARVSTVDSAAVQVIIDSDYVKTTLKVGSTNTIFRYVSTAGQTAFTGNDANSAALAYNPGAVQVFLNGSLLTPTVDFTTDSGDTITLVSGAALGSELVINTYKDGIITPTNALPIIGGELTGNLTMGDNKKIKLGNDSDAEIFHNSSNTIINDKGTGDILLQVAGTTHFQTNATGVQVPDNKKLQLGTSNDLEIIHDGSNSIINDAGTGDLKLQIGGSDKVAVTGSGITVTGSVISNTGFSVGNTAVLGQEIDVSSGDFTLDVAGDIMLDADGGDFRFADGGTTVGKITISATDFVFDATAQDRDIIFKGDDGGSAVTALTLDMSAAGAAAFNSYITSTAVYGKGDANTGIQFDGSDVITLHTGGAERMRIDNGGRVGIGTSSPASYYARELVISSANQGGITIVGGTSDTGQYIMFADGTSGSDRYRGFIQYDHANNQMIFATDGGERVRIDASGNVGIGNTVMSSMSADARQLVVGTGSGNKGITIFSATNGTGNIYYADGSSGATRYRGWLEYAHASDVLAFGVAGAERMRITSAGNVGIGNTNPEAFGSLTDNLVIGTTSGENGMTIASGTGNSGRIQFADNTASPFRGAIEYAHSSDRLIFYTAGSNRMFIGVGGRIQTFNCTGSNGALNLVGEGGLSYRAVAFQHVGNGSEIGSIITNGSGTSYNTSSDYRLKENVTTSWDATSRLKQLKPSRFNFKIDANTIVDGFLAHEVSSIIPEAISGTKDEVDAEGNPLYQSIDQSKLVPLLVKTIQELEARITELENK